MEENHQGEIIDTPSIQVDDSNCLNSEPDSSLPPLQASTSTPQSDQQDESVTDNISTCINTDQTDVSINTDETDEKGLTRQGSNVSLSSNTLCKGVYDNFRGSHPLYEDTVLTIEGLHLYLNSCFTCGVYWKADHVTIGCNECGGYGLKRPCPECDGQCQVMWKRNLTMSHTNHRAKWSGECGFKSKDTIEESLMPALEKLTTSPQPAAPSPVIPQQAATTTS